MSDIHSLLIAAILGVVEGLTEFLPVSSTGHMIIVGHLLGFEGETANTFEVVIQLGSILAVVVMFWRRLFGLIGIHFGKPPEHEGQGSGRLSLIHILLGMVPAVVLGLLFHDTIKSLFNPVNVMYALIVGGLLLIAAEVLKPKQPRAVGIDDMTYRQAFVIGCFQCLALWPGFSRSGATREKFSFPAMIRRLPRRYGDSSTRFQPPRSRDWWTGTTPAPTKIWTFLHSLTAAPP